MNGDASGSGAGAVGRRWVWEKRDRYQPWTWLAALGVGGAVLMAVAGLPPVDLHGPLHRFGVMDPFCGGTRAARYAVLGQWRVAWRYNPLGPAAVLAGALMVLRAAIGLGMGRWWTPAASPSTRWRRMWLASLVAGLVILEVRQQLLAPLLVAP